MADTHEHKPGTMDISAQERTYHGFLKMVVWVCVLGAVFLLLLAMYNA